MNKEAFVRYFSDGIFFNLKKMMLMRYLMDRNEYDMALYVFCIVDLKTLNEVFKMLKERK